MAISVPVASRDATPPKLNPEQQDSKRRLAMELAPKYRTEFVDQM